MHPTGLLNWMLLSTVLLGAWWLCYRVALRQERSFAYNRAFLGLGPLLAAGLPLLPMAWPAGWSVGPAVLTGVASGLLPEAVVGAGASREAAGADGLFCLLVFYLSGAVLRLGHLGWALGRLWLSTRHLTRQPCAGYTLAHTHGQLPTSSFGRLVLWDETLPMSAAEASQVLRHELAHVRQGHTYDRLLLELLRAALWFNPFVHLCGRALALTHEYLADEAALRDESTPFSATRSYAHLLARQVATRLGFSVPLAHSFSHSQTLHRIAMIQKTAPIRRWKQWLALPLVALLLVVVAGGRTAAQGGPPAPKPTAAPRKGTPPPPVVFDNPDVFPELPGGGGPAAIVGFIQQHLAYPAVVPAARRSGRVFASFVVTAEGVVQAPKVVKGLSAEYDEAVLAAIAQLPRFVPGTKDGRPVAVSFTVPVQFRFAQEGPAKSK